MSTTNISFIADLDVTRDDLSIKVRVINHWKQMSFYNKNEIWSIELILVDEQGRKIQASVPKKFLYRFKKILKDGKSYYITSPSFASLKPNTFRLQRDDRLDSSSHTFSLIPANQVSEYDDFMVKNKLKTISEVWEPVEICTFILVGTIKGILQNEKWFYQACTNCSSKAVPNNDQVDGTAKSYECHNVDCTKTTTSVVPRYKIPIRVQDNTGTITLTLFEREGRYLLKKSAKEFFNTVAKKGDNVDLYPMEMNALKGLKFAFKISSNRFSVSKKTNQYGIVRISDDESLIEQLEDRFNSSQADNSQSLDVNSSDFQSLDNKTLKDAISATDDNITPNTLDKNSATSPLKISTTPVLKRNLQEVFDLESNENFSSSKTPKTSPDGPTKELLKVKVEKNV
ncbi:unnamed protein product [Lactuca saligna]|uniref:Replication factor A C-terminal domain-containing protein n=1 Tax=Lactuca saligna TaxID=75948 RepID=A0AA36A456_LACSI|nr:unnamed protein product [Lactuca saligna]